MDGVLLDSLDAHFKAWVEFWNRRGKKLTLRMFNEIVATSTEETLAIRNKTFRTHIPIAAGVRERNKILRKYLQGITLYPGARKLLASLQDRPLAIGTSTGRATTKYLLRRFKLARYFDVVVTKDDVPRSKPNPAIYLLAAKRLKVKPRDCVVVEDAPNGIVAAKRARMKVIAVQQTFSDGVLHRADVVVPTIRSPKLLAYLNKP